MLKLNQSHQSECSSDITPLHDDVLVFAFWIMLNQR